MPVAKATGGGLGGFGVTGGGAWPAGFGSELSVGLFGISRPPVTAALGDAGFERPWLNRWLRGRGLLRWILASVSHGQSEEQV